MSKQKRKKTKAGARAAPGPGPANAERGADGRLHLRLHRDPSGNAYVALRAPVFGEAWQNELAAGAANTALGIFGEEPSFERTLELARRAMTATSRLVQGQLAQARAGAVACTAGCDHCCHQSVGVTAPEAFAILDFLKQRSSAGELANVAAHLAEREERTRGLSAEQRFSPELPCPFLAAGECSIYEVRPLVCRGMNSLDARECDQRLREPEARAAFLAQGSGGHCYLEPIRSARAVSAGLQLGLSELYRLDMRPLELTAALHLLLNGPVGAAEAWLRGERPLEAAVHRSALSDPQLAELSGALVPDPSS